jgi:23S rRNA (guanosine2251-2'-O)-methyltransferase
VPWEHRSTAVEAVLELKRAGYAVWCVEQTVNALPLHEWKAPAARLALVFGNELEGVSPAVIAECDGALVIPQRGTKHSLNVSVCAGITLWHVAGRR